MGWLERWRGRAARQGEAGRGGAAAREDGAAARQGAARDVVVVSRAGCHLCVEMEQVVGQVLTEERAAGGRPGPPAGGARLRVVDLDELGREDPAVLERWTTRVPVLLVDGREVAHWQVDPETVRSALRR